jgi:hypothetical protein
MLPLEGLYLPVGLSAGRVPASAFPCTSHPGADVGQQVTRACKFRAGEAYVCGGSLRIPRSRDEGFRAGVGNGIPAGSSGLEEVALIGNIRQGIILAEVLRDALAQSEKPQDREDDHDDADDVDDAVHELTL